MFFLFLISLHVHIKRPYSFPLIKSIFNCSVVLGGFTSPYGQGSTVIYSKLIVQFQELVEIIDIKYPLAY